MSFMSTRCLILVYFCSCTVWFMVLCFVFFFFKQKTAYEMRISDWSSDVCSSDLRHAAADQPRGRQSDQDQDGDRRRVGERRHPVVEAVRLDQELRQPGHVGEILRRDRKSTRLNSSH